MSKMVAAAAVRVALGCRINQRQILRCACFQKASFQGTRQSFRLAGANKAVRRNNVAVFNEKSRFFCCNDFYLFHFVPSPVSRNK